MDDKEKRNKKAREKYHTDEGLKAEHGRRRTLKVRYSKARYDAGRRASGEKPFTITFDEYVAIVGKHCTYCNLSLQNETGSGIDRIDNDKGYETGNCNSCCGSCNRRRSKSMDADEFLKQSKLNGYWNE